MSAGNYRQGRVAEIPGVATAGNGISAGVLVDVHQNRRIHTRNPFRQSCPGHRPPMANGLSLAYEKKH